jgi:hypothetical protein
MATASTQARPGGLPWIVILVGALFAILAAIDLAGEVNLSVRGQRETGIIVATEGGVGRMRTVTARVQVRPRDAAPFFAEIRDTLGTHGWKEGDAVDILCARVHADHLDCVADRWLDRYALTLVVFGLGVAILWATFARRRAFRADA